MNRLTGPNGVVTKIYRVHFKITWPFVGVFMVGMAVKLNKGEKTLLPTLQQFSKQFKTSFAVAGAFFIGASSLPVSAWFILICEGVRQTNTKPLIIRASRLFGQPWQRRP